MRYELNLSSFLLIIYFFKFPTVFKSYGKITEDHTSKKNSLKLVKYNFHAKTNRGFIPPSKSYSLLFNVECANEKKHLRE